jgi:hypothetical protein
MKSTLFTVIGVISMAANVQAACKPKCGLNQYCSHPGPVFNGQCVPKKQNNQICARNDECLSNNCLIRRPSLKGICRPKPIIPIPKEPF